MRIGSLFSGYGGLDLAVREVFPDAETAWVSDIDGCEKQTHKGRMCSMHAKRVQIHGDPHYSAPRGRPRKPQGEQQANALAALKERLAERKEAVGSGPIPGPPCRSEDPELFYPPAGAGNQPAVMAAKAVCARCPVTAECLQEAMEAEVTELRYGIWGGLTAKERHALSRRTHESR